MHFNNFISFKEPAVAIGGESTVTKDEIAESGTSISIQG